MTRAIGVSPRQCKMADVERELAAADDRLAAASCSKRAIVSMNMPGSGSKPIVTCFCSA